MNKVSPAKIKALFKAQVDELTQFFVRVADRIEGKQNEKADLSQLAQSIFLSVSVAFEVTLSDLFTAYANRKPQRLQVEYEERIRKSVRDKFGEWVNRISMPHAQHGTP